MNPVEKFRSELARHGLHFSGPILADGKIHRFDPGEDGEPNSWFVLHPGEHLAGAFGCWKRGLSETWNEGRLTDMSSGEWSRVQQEWAKSKKLADEDRRLRQKGAAEEAVRLFEVAAPVVAHPYLTRKGIRPPAGVRQLAELLLVPLRDETGVLCSLQKIFPDGQKRFLSGGKIAGCFFEIPGPAESPLVVCEGLATGASLHSATGWGVSCAMSAGNLLAVAEAMRAKHPTRKIIICCDNDAFTPRNPGLTSATEAAKKIGARLAVPQFKNPEKGRSDFNDLCQMEGLAAVKETISAAEQIKETDEELFHRLASLGAGDYDRVRQQEAEKAGIRLGTLDEEVTKRRKKSAGTDSLQGEPLSLPEIEPWPETVKGSDVLDEVASTIQKYISLPTHLADVIALWCAHVHCYELFKCSPRLNISSPEKGCGKTCLRDLISFFVPRALLAEDATPAAIFRAAAKCRPAPTFLFDEVDSWLHGNEDLRGILNSGYRQPGGLLRCVGDDHEPRVFKVFCPACFCGIGTLPATLYDRSLIIRLQRARPGEVQSRMDLCPPETFKELGQKLARFIQDSLPFFRGCNPKLPKLALNRLADNWRPLFAVAEAAGGEWTERVASAFAAMVEKDDSEAGGIRMRLLLDIREIFSSTAKDRIFSCELVELLLGIGDGPWNEINKGRPINEYWLSGQLGKFDVHPSRWRGGGAKQRRGYCLSDLASVFDRYLSSPPNPVVTGCHSVTEAENIDDSPLFEVSQATLVGHPEKSILTNKDGGCDTVTLQIPPLSGNSFVLI